MSDASARQEASSRTCAIIAARAANKQKATDVIVQEVRDLVGETDYFVIATAANTRQAEAVVDEVEDQLRKRAHVKPLHRELAQDSSWLLLDYGDVVVHVFRSEAREYYRLESMWSDAPILDLTQEEGFADAVYSPRIAEMLGEDS